MGYRRTRCVMLVQFLFYFPSCTSTHKIDPENLQTNFVSLLVFFACFFVSVFFLHFFVCFGYPFYLALCTETYRSISALYYRGAAIILLVYDITNKVLLINWIGKSARFVILCDYGLIACGSFFAFLRDSCAGVFAPS